MITYTQAYMIKKAADQNFQKQMAASENAYKKQRSQAVSSAASKARASGVKPMPTAQANAAYDAGKARQNSAQITADRAKRQDENIRRIQAQIEAKRGQLRTSRWLNNAAGASARAGVEADIRNLEGQLAKLQGVGQQVAAAPAQKRPQPVVAQIGRTPGAPKRAPGIYNAQGQIWNGSTFVDVPQQAIAGKAAPSAGKV